MLPNMKHIILANMNVNVHNSIYPLLYCGA